MEFIAFLNPQTRQAESPSQLRDGMLRLARTAEESGFHGISAGQHYVADFTQFQLLPYLARLTGTVDDMTIATGVVLLPFHHPVDLAERLATLDALHDNQTIFGAGAGYRTAEFEAFGIPKADRVPRMVECLKLTRSLLTSDSVTHDGEFWSLNDVSIPFQPASEMPVWLAANADPAVRRAARLADAWYVNPHATITEIKSQKATHYDPVREEAGRDTSVPLIRETFVADTTEKAMQTAREYLFDKYRRYIDWGQDEAMENTQDLHRPFVELANDRFLLGTPAEVCSEIERYRDELDVEYLAVRSHWPGIDYETVADSFELFGDEVIPNV